ncbi:MAG: DUF3892 domain-containing protein [Myxococcota bacterium]
MSSYYAKKVRKEKAGSGNNSHEHIVGVLTGDGVFHSNKAVTDSIDNGNDWYTEVSGEPKAKIRKVSYCPQSACLHSPYLTTHPDHTEKNNLENLPRG